MAAGLGSVWVIDQSKPELIQIDPETAGRRAVRLDEPFPETLFPPSIAAGEGGIWLAFVGESGGVSGEWLWRVDAATGEIVKLDRAIDAGSVVIGGGAVWVTSELEKGCSRSCLARSWWRRRSTVRRSAFWRRWRSERQGLWILLARITDVSFSTENELWRIDPVSGKELARLDLPLRTRRFRR